MTRLLTPHPRQHTHFAAARRVRDVVVGSCLPLFAAAAQGGASSAGLPVAASWFLRRYEADQGLPETRISTLTQTPDGYLWLGTRRGLVRFDGLNFTLYSPENTPALPSFRIQSVTSDRAGRLWIGTSNGLVVKDHGGFRRVDTLQVPAVGVLDVMEDRSGRLWVCTQGGVRVGNGAVFRAVPGSTEYTYAAEEDAFGRVWLAGRRSLAWTRGDSIVDVTALAPNGRRYYDVAAAGASLWVGTRVGAQEIRMDADGTPRAGTLVSTAQGSDEHAVWVVDRTRDGAIWLGTADRGVMLWDGKTLRAQEAPVDNSRDPIWGFHEDARGRMWVGTGSGLHRYQRSAFTTFAEGSPVLAAWAVRGDARGQLWATWEDGSIGRWDGQRLVQALGRAPRVASSSAWQYQDGLLVARGGERLVHLRSGAPPRPMTVPGLPNAEILGLWEDTDGTAWFMTYDGLFHAAGGTARKVDGEVGLDDDEVPREMLRDSRGRLVLGRPGLTIVDRGRVARVGPAEGLTDPDVRVILPQGDNLWVGTADSGLFLVRNDRAKSLGHLDARLHREILGVVEDDLGFLWITSSFGLSRVSRADLEAVARGTATGVEVRSFDRSDGLPTTEFNGEYQGSLYKHTDGTLWLPSYAGVVRVDPLQVARDTLPPQIHIERVVVDGVEQPVRDGLTLPSGVNRVEFTFAATNALVPSRVRMQFRVVGLDSGWTDVGQRRTVSVGPLRGGSYQYDIRAANEEGNWTARPASLAFSVRLAVFERRWFYPGIILFGLGAAAAIARARQHALVQRGRELTRVVDDRTQELVAARATLEHRVEARTAELAGQLAERKRLEQQLVQAQKLEGIGRLAGGVAHEINNSMTGVLGFTELAALATRDNPAVVRDLQEVRRAGERVAAITRQLLTFARLQHSEPTEVDLGVLVEQMERSVQQAAGDRVRVEIVATPGLRRLRADRSQLEQVLLNLVMNARDAVGDGGAVTVQVSGRTLTVPQTIGGASLPAGSYVVLAVTDTGSGMTEDVRSRLFEPFFTTKALDRGSGMGLAVCHGIATRHGGAIAVESVLGEGTTVAVWLPAPVAPTGAVTPGVEAPSASGRETVLLVEDERSVREVARRTLVMNGYEVLVASDGREALEVAEQHLVSIDLVLTDVIMPRVGGLDLARALRSHREDLPLVFMSGFVGSEPDLEAALAALGPLMPKPFTSDTLVSTVRRELDRRRRGASSDGATG